MWLLCFIFIAYSALTVDLITNIDNKRSNSERFMSKEGKIVDVSLDMHGIGFYTDDRLFPPSMELEVRLTATAALSLISTVVPS